MDLSAKTRGPAVAGPSSVGAPSDGALLEGVRSGDQAAYRQLVERLFASVYRAAMRVLRSNVEAEDVSQEVFLKIWRETPELRSETSLRSWSIRVATNAAIDRLRKRKPELWDEVPERMDNSPAVDRNLVEGEATDTVQKAIDALPERQRMALMLTYFEGMANKETAEMMGVSVDALESLLARGRRTLKASLADNWGELLEDLTEVSAAKGNWSVLA